MVLLAGWVVAGYHLGLMIASHLDTVCPPMVLEHANAVLPDGGRFPMMGACNQP
jgi:hypothetical protein